MSCHSQTPKQPVSATTSAANGADNLDVSTNDLLGELEDLTAPYVNLARKVQQLSYERILVIEKDTELATIDAQLHEMKREAVELGRRRERIISRLPPQLLDRPRDALDKAVTELEREFLQSEEVLLLSFLGPILKMANNVDAQIARAQADLSSIQGLTTKTGLGLSLEIFRAALHDFRNAFRHYGNERSKAIGREIVHLDAMLSGEQPSLDLAGRSENDDENADGDDLTATPSTMMSSLNLGATLSSIGEDLLGEFSPSALNENKNDCDSMFVFDRTNPPGLSDIAKWLGLDDSVTAAVLLNSKPIQNAYTAYRSPPGQSSAGNPEGLKLNMPLFTYSKETLCEWRDKLGHKQHDGLDFSAALFARQVVWFLENVCDEVNWEPVSSRIRGLDDFETARSRWAIALQILWFLEKAFSS
ncbi:hypothetical protein F4861DRAFT_547069 [Xylaria intraflava]|nr:hypothetical protein F4861DRAFT_547069 [Xylaria intraflava]